MANKLMTLGYAWSTQGLSCEGEPWTLPTAQVGGQGKLDSTSELRCSDPEVLKLTPTASAKENDLNLDSCEVRNTSENSWKIPQDEGSCQTWSPFMSILLYDGEVMYPDSGPSVFLSLNTRGRR